jgi:hypothetical protein
MTILCPLGYDVSGSNRRNFLGWWPLQSAHDDLVQNHHYFMTLFSRVMMKRSLVNTFLVVGRVATGLAVGGVRVGARCKMVGQKSCWGRGPVVGSGGGGESSPSMPARATCAPKEVEASQAGRHGDNHCRNTRVVWKLSRAHGELGGDLPRPSVVQAVKETDSTILVAESPRHQGEARP